MLMTAPGALGATSTGRGAIITDGKFFMGRQQEMNKGKKRAIAVCAMASTTYSAIHGSVRRLRMYMLSAWMYIPVPGTYILYLQTEPRAATGQLLVVVYHGIDKVHHGLGHAEVAE